MRLTDEQLLQLLFSSLPNADPALAGAIVSVIEEVQEKRKTVEILFQPSNLLSAETRFVYTFTCPKCKNPIDLVGVKPTKIRPHYCPHCGVNVTWKE